MRLDFTDAKMVDVIHTNADSLLMGGLGAFEPMGHVDFYPNGGRVQKGCANLFVGGVSDILWRKDWEDFCFLLLLGLFCFICLLLLLCFICFLKIILLFLSYFVFIFMFFFYQNIHPLLFLI